MHLSIFAGILFILGFIAYMHYQTTRIRDDAEQDAREYRAKIAAKFNPNLPQIKYVTRPSLRYQIKQLLGWPREVIGQLRTLCHWTYKPHIVRS